MSEQTFTFECPSCSQRISASANDKGARSAAPACGVDFIVPDPPPPVRQKNFREQLAEKLEQARGQAIAWVPKSGMAGQSQDTILFLRNLSAEAETAFARFVTFLERNGNLLLFEFKSQSQYRFISGATQLRIGRNFIGVGWFMEEGGIKRRLKKLPKKVSFEVWSNYLSSLASPFQTRDYTKH